MGMTSTVVFSAVVIFGLLAYHVMSNQVDKTATSGTVREVIGCNKETCCVIIESDKTISKGYIDKNETPLSGDKVVRFQYYAEHKWSVVVL